MITKHIRAFLPSMALAALLAGLSGLSGLSGCGWHPGSRVSLDRRQLTLLLEQQSLVPLQIFRACHWLSNHERAPWSEVSRRVPCGGSVF